MKKKVSIYVKGDTNTPDYYRIHQYLNNLNGLNCTYHQMLSTDMYKKVMPMSQQGKIMQILIFCIIYLRMTTALFYDLFKKPKYIVVLRRIVPRFMPFPIKLLLKKNIKNGTKVIWDFDDNILEFRELSLKDFHFFSKISNNISVTHEDLRELIEKKYWRKVKILPTTDGDSLHFYPNEECERLRENSLKKQINLIWLATSVNLPFLKSIASFLDEAALCIKEKEGRVLHLKVVCNQPLRCSFKHLVIENHQWSKDTAIKELKSAHIGIMPLVDSKIARGKGGFKLVQYLSFGLPCIGTDVGFNRHVINSNCGILVPEGEGSQWTKAILKLSGTDCWSSFSKEAYKQWKEEFPYSKNLEYWKEILK